MRGALLALFIGAAILLPVVIADDADGADVHTVTFRDYDGADIVSYDIYDGRNIQDTAPHYYAMRPYWADVDTGYYWPADKAVTKDLQLRPCEEKPPEEPADNTGYIIAAGIVLLAAIGAGLVYFMRKR